MDPAHRLRAIVAFVQAADAGSLAAAARVLGVTSAAVSKGVAGLERSLGVRLMNRTTRSLQLTDEGAAFLRKARLAIEALDAAVDTVAAQRAEPGGRVRISTSTAFGYEHLMPIVPGLLERYPQLSLEVSFDDRVVDVVASGFDLVLRGGTLRDSDLVSRPVCRLDTVLVASPGYLARHGVPHSLDELRGHRLIARRFLSGSVAPWNFAGSEKSVVPFDPSDSAILTLSAPEASLRAAVDGIGIAQVGVYLAWPLLQRGSLKVVMYRHYHPGSFELALQYPHRALIAPRVRVTVDYLLEAFARQEALNVPAEALKQHAARAKPRSR